MHPSRSLALTVTTAVGALLLSGCVANNPGAAESGQSGQGGTAAPLSVTIADDSCVVSADTTPRGPPPSH